MTYEENIRAHAEFIAHAMWGQSVPMIIWEDLTAESKEREIKRYMFLGKMFLKSMGVSYMAGHRDATHDTRTLQELMEGYGLIPKIQKLLI